MSWQVHEWVLNHAAQHGWRGTVLNVLNAMAHHAHKDGSGIFPKLETLAKECGGITVRAVQKAIQKLERSGVLVREEPGGGRKPARWRIVMTFGGEVNAGSPQRRTAEPQAVAASTPMNRPKNLQRTVLREPEGKIPKSFAEVLAKVLSAKSVQNVSGDGGATLKEGTAEKRTEVDGSNTRDGGRPGGVRPVEAADGTVFDFEALKRKMVAEQKR